MASNLLKNIKPEKWNLHTNQAGFSELFVQSKDKHGVILLEDVVKMDLLDQYAENVIEYTSRFNCANSLSYAPANITGKYVVYPSYGDFPDAYFLRSYGKWWIKRAAYQKEYMLQDLDPLAAEDFITIQFEIAVIPRDICIYEIYNPGAIVRIWGKINTGNKSWVILWEGPPQKCPDESRKFHPQIRTINNLVNTIRIEFNQSQLKYHTSIDAVVLGGYIQSELVNEILNVQIKVDKNKKTINRVQEITSDTLDAKDSVDYFSELPYEVIMHIFQYLDLKSLFLCAQVNRRWYEICNDPVLYQNLSLKRYWHIVNSNVLKIFENKCRNIKKLDLSWCGNEDENFKSTFTSFLANICKNLTHLSLGNCRFLSNDVIQSISQCNELIDLRLKNTPSWRISRLDCLNKLVSLDLTSSLIQDNDLIQILKSNPNMKHLIIDLCEDLRRLDHVVAAAAQYTKKLETWSSWKSPSLTFEGAKHFGTLENLTDLDLGWCLLTTHPNDSLTKIAEGCKKLKRLILSEWRGVNDTLLLPIILNCHDLEQLDLLGIRSLSKDICETALVTLKKLTLLDISFCTRIDQSQVELWRERFPHINIPRSCQFLVNYM